jgi:phage FluMu protein Com
MEFKALKKSKYKDTILCPVCGKVFGEWEEVIGKVTIKKHCPRCEKIRYITKKG